MTDPRRDGGPLPASPGAPRAAAWWEILARGARRRCPACGEGSLYDGWLTLRRRCGACGDRFVENPGDPWGFFLIVDRILFVVPLVVATYLGFTAGPSALLAACILVIVPMVATTPHRYGLSVALDFLVRRATGSNPG